MAKEKNYADECFYAIRQLEGIQANFKFKRSADPELNRRVRYEFDQALEERIQSLKGRLRLMQEGQKIKKKIQMDW